MNETLRYIADSLRGALPDSELQDAALWIAEETTGLSRTEILCKSTIIIPNLEIIFKQIRVGKPLQYIFETAYWGGLRLKVTPATLIPRPETYGIIDCFARHYTSSRPLRVLDIGTGSGCIAIALKKRFPELQVEACDKSLEALQVARQNAASHEADIRFFQCDILKDEIGGYDVLVSNPPYVRESEKAQMDDRVLLFEPATALFVSDEDPLVFYRYIARRKAPALVFEINEALAAETVQMLVQEGYAKTEIYKDLDSKDRILFSQL